MENKGIKVLSVCLSLLFVLAIALLFIGIIIEYNKSPTIVNQSMSTFIQDTSKTAEYFLPGTDRFSDTLRARIATDKNIAGVSIKQNGKIIFAYPFPSEYISVDANGEPQMTSSSIMIKINSQTVDLNGLPATITAAIYSLQPSKIYSYIRIAFIIILGATLIAGVALLYTYISTDQDNSFDYDSSDYDDEYENNSNQFDIKEDTKENVSNSLETFDSIIPISSDINEEKNNVKDKIIQEEKAEALEETNTQEPEISQEEYKENIEKDVNPVSSEPSGLFSPITGFCWEAYLESRLDSELVRSASSGEDIALIIVSIEELDRTSDMAHKIYEQILDMFKFRDMIFEYKNTGFSCILHDMPVDKAISMAEQLYTSITKILNQFEVNNEVGIGISTRSFRLIPGKRLFTEAEQALKHAFNDEETAIVAFRVDPSKYREYISEATTT